MKAKEDWIKALLIATHWSESGKDRSVWENQLDEQTTKNSVTNLEIKLKYKQRTSYLHGVHPPLTVGSGGRPFCQIFKGGEGAWQDLNF